MKRLLPTFLLLLPLAAHATPDREQVERSLNGIEYVPTRQALLRMGPGVDQVLRDIALKPPARRMLARTRAITLLRLFPGRKTRDTLKQVIAATAKSKKGVDLLHLQQALTSYAIVAGPGSLARLKPFLAHPSMDVRYAAAEAVRLSRSSQAITVLQQRVKQEPSAMVRHQLRQQVELIKRPEIKKR